MSSLYFMIVINPPAMVCTPQSFASLHPSLRPHALQPICRTRLTRSQMKSLSRLSFLPLFPRTESFFHLSDPAATHSPHSHLPLLLLLPFLLHYFHLSSSLLLSSLLSYSRLISSFSKLHFFNFASFLFFPPSPTSPAHLLSLLSRSSSVCSCSIAMPLLSTPPTSLLLLQLQERERRVKGSGISRGGIKD